MAPITTASNEETHQALLDKLDMQLVSKPFRDPNWKPPQRRNKNLKQILSEAQRAQQSFLNTQQNSGATTPQIGTDSEGVLALHPNPAQGSQQLSRMVLEINTNKQQPVSGNLAVPTAGPSVTYTSIQAGPSTKKPRKYCDITGLPTVYTDPKTGLHYFNKEIYAVVKGLSTAQVQEYLAARNANTVLKEHAACVDRSDGVGNDKCAGQAPWSTWFHGRQCALVDGAGERVMSPALADTVGDSFAHASDSEIDHQGKKRVPQMVAAIKHVKVAHSVFAPEIPAQRTHQKERKNYAHVSSDEDGEEDE